MYMYHTYIYNCIYIYIYTLNKHLGVRPVAGATKGIGACESFASKCPSKSILALSRLPSSSIQPLGVYKIRVLRF